MKVPSLLFLVGAGIAISKVVPPWPIPIRTPTSSLADYGSNGYGQPTKRDAREKCTPPKYPGPQVRRSLVYAGSINNVTLSRRMQLPAPGAVDQFILHETDEDGDAVPAVWEQRDPEVKPPAPPSYYDINTALFYDFEQERSIAATRLKGCTMLAVISRKGVYIGHYWESIAFSPDEDLLKDGDTQQAIFQRTVLNGLKDGISDPDRPSQMSFTKFAQQLGDDFVKAYLIRPNVNSEDNADGRDGYPDEWRRMKDVVVGALPKIGEPGRWTEIIYNVEQNEALLDTTPRGRVLFKIDPKHVPRASRRGKDTRLAILWVETREVHRDQWHDP